MSVATPPSAPPPAPVSEACPVCGSPLQREQDWCLSCGAAARTRLAATPNWRAPTATVAIIAALALGVLVAALVELAGSSTTTYSRPAAGLSSPRAGLPTQSATGGATSPPATPTAPTQTSTATAPATGAPATPTTTAPAGGATAPGRGASGATGAGTTGTTNPAAPSSSGGSTARTGK